MNIQRPVVWAIASATLIGASLTTYAMAQERSPASSRQDASGAAANAVPAGPTNSVTHLLQFAISESQNSLLSSTRDAETQALIIQACNRASFAGMTPSEQDAYRKVIDIEKWATNKTVWRDIAKTKSMVNELSKVTPEQNATAEKLRSAIWAKIMNPTAEVIKQTPMLGLTQAEKLHERQDPVNSKIVQIHNKWLGAQVDDACKQVRETLTKEQRAEWDAIWALYQKHLPKITP